MPDDRAMTGLAETVDAEALILEATRYLAVVEFFRAERCEPTWQPEQRSGDVVRRRRPRRTSGGRSSRAPRR